MYTRWKNNRIITWSKVRLWPLRKAKNTTTQRLKMPSTNHCQNVIANMTPFSLIRKKYKKFTFLFLIQPKPNKLCIIEIVLTLSFLQMLIW